jgi:hypothetical protein
VRNHTHPAIRKVMSLICRWVLSKSANQADAARKLQISAATLRVYLPVTQAKKVRSLGIQGGHTTWVAPTWREVWTVIREITEIGKDSKNANVDLLPSESAASGRAADGA